MQSAGRVKTRVENEGIQTEFNLVRSLAEKGRERNMAANRGALTIKGCFIGGRPLKILCVEERIRREREIEH